MLVQYVLQIINPSISLFNGYCFLISTTLVAKISLHGSWHLVQRYACYGLFDPSIHLFSSFVRYISFSSCVYKIVSLDLTSKFSFSCTFTVFFPTFSQFSQNLIQPCITIKLLVI